MLRDCGQQHSTEFFCRHALAPHSASLLRKNMRVRLWVRSWVDLGKTVCFQLLKPFSMSPSTGTTAGREWLEIEGGVISSLMQQLIRRKPAEITP